MSTQTGSISFEAVGGFNSYASQNYATLSQIKGQFATCGTGASTAAKVATIVPEDSSWTLYNGATITVKFTSANTTTTPTLNVNSTGAKQIRDYNGNELTKAAREWLAGAAIALTYDGTYWRIQDSNLMERLYNAETEIDQNTTDISLRATKEEMTAAIDDVKITKSACGENIITEDTAELPLHSISGNGWAEQCVTTGKNLLEFSNSSNPNRNGYTYIKESADSIIATKNDDGGKFFARFIVHISSAGSYTLSIGDGSNVLYIYSDELWGQGVHTNIRVTSSAPLTLTFDDAGDYVLGFYNANVAGTTVSVTAPQLEAGSTATSYEPYSGGAPSPSPDYPQEIKICRGRNLLKNTPISHKPTQYEAYVLSIGEPLKEGQTYTIQFWGVSGTIDDSRANRLQVFAGGWVHVINSNVSVDNNGYATTTFTVSSSVAGNSTLYIFNGTGSHSSYNLTIDHWQLELSHTPTPYVPYGHVGLEVQGKNLIQKRILGYVNQAHVAIDNASEAYLFYAETGKKYTFSSTPTANRSILGHVSTPNVVNGTPVLEMVSLGLNDQQAKTWTSTWTGWTVIYANNAKSDAVAATAQIEEGSVATSYQAPYHTTTPIPLPLKSDGERWAGGLPDGTADMLAIDSAGRWEWTSQSDEVVFDGSSDENWKYETTSQGGSFYIFVSNAIVPSYGNSLLLTHAKSAPSASVLAGAAYISQSKNLNITIGDQLSITTAADFRTWLASNNVTLLYLLATPTTEHGYIDLPILSNNCIISIPELENTCGTWWTLSGQEIGKAHQSNAKENAELRITANGISSEVSKISSAKYVTTGYNYTLAQIKTYAAEGHSDNWTIASDDSIRVGDTVYVKVQDTTRTCPVYIKVKVTAISSPTRITGISHGYEDVLPVDTIKSTINQSSDSVKIAANHVNIEGAAIFSSGGAYDKSTTVVKTETQWYSSTSPTTKANGSWGTSQPTVTAGRYIWQRELVTYANGNTVYKPSEAGVCIQGQTDLSSYSTTSQMNSAIGDAIDNIEIGGTNLLLNSQSINLTDNLFINSTTTIDTNAPNKDNIKPYLLDNSASSGKYLVINFPALTIGEIYTFSFDYLRDYATTNLIININGETNIVATINDSLWRRHSITFIASSETTNAKIYTNQSSRTLWMRHFKLEKGNKATDWSPAPEDIDASLDNLSNALGGFDILWNRASFASDQDSGGECYLCALDPLTNQRSDTNGWVMWNGTKRTITKGMYNINTVAPYNIPIYIVYRLSNATSTTGAGYYVWYNSGWKSTPQSAGTVSTWTWAEATDMVLGKFVEPGSEIAFTECETYNPPRKWGAITTDTTTAHSAQSTANNAAPKTSAVSRTQRIYYRTNTALSGSITGPTTWIDESGNKYNTTAPTTAITGWSTKPTPLAASTASNTSKYLYLYTCTQTQTVSQAANNGTACSASTVLLDDTETVIDGGKIITGSVTANQIAANAVTADKINVNNLAAINSNLGTLTAGTIDASKVIINNIDASKITSGYISADRINSGSISIGKLDSDAQNQVFYTYSSNGNTDNYVKLCTIKAANSYINRDVTFTISSRGSRMETEVNWAFINSGTVASTTVSHAYATGDVPLYYVNEGSGVYGIYAQKAESYDTLQIHNLYNPHLSGGIVITWLGTNTASLPTGYIAFTQLAGSRTSASIDNAARTATNYLTTITGTSGISVHDVNNTTNYINIKSNTIDIVTDGVSRIKSYLDNTTPKIRVGAESGGHAIFSPTGMSIWAETGGCIADFGETVKINGLGGSYLELDSDNLKLIDKEENKYLHISDLRGSDGTGEIIQKYYGPGTTFYLDPSAEDTNYTVEVFKNTVDGFEDITSSYTITKDTSSIKFSPSLTEDIFFQVTYRSSTYRLKAYTLGIRATDEFIGLLSVCEGNYTVASGKYSHAEGESATASGGWSHAEGNYTTAFGNCSHAEGEQTYAAGGWSHAEGCRTTASGSYSHAEGENTIASGYYSHAEGWNTVASNPMSHAEGSRTIANGYYSHVEGKSTKATRPASHAEGENTTASGSYSHAEGQSTTASGVASHAEGYNTVANGEYYSHAEGYSTVANGSYSHAQNWATIAESQNQTALGKFNIKDANNTYAVIIGNGTSYVARSNALAVRWNGLVDDANGVTTCGMPIGTIIDYAGSNVPTGWLVCDGSAVSRTSFPLLFAAIGTTWGSGNGSTTFNLPDFRGRTSIGAGTGTAGGATAHSLAGKGGDQRMRNHKHTMDSSGSTTTGAGSNHSHGMTHSHWMTLNNYGSNAGSGINWQYWSAGGSNRCGTYQNNNDMIKNYSGNTGGESAHTHSVPNHTHTMQNAGGGSQSENEANMQPYAVVRKLIRAA